MCQWFPSEYYGNEREGGKNRHFYHVHDAVSYSNPVKRGERLIRFAPLSRCITSFLTELYCEKVVYYCFFKKHVVLSSLRNLCFIIVVTLIITEHSINSERIIVHDQHTLRASHTLFIEKVGNTLLCQVGR